MNRKSLGAVFAGVLAVGSTALAHVPSFGSTEPAGPRQHPTVALVSLASPTAQLPTAQSPGAVGRQWDPRLVSPRPGMRNVRPVPWREAQPLDDRTVRVSYISGVEPCSVLDHVTVDYGASTVTITLYEGTDPLAEGQACIMIAVRKTTVVVLDQPLRGRTIIDGAAPLRAGHPG